MSRAEIPTGEELAAAAGRTDRAARSETSAETSPPPVPSQAPVETAATADPPLPAGRVTRRPTRRLLTLAGHPLVLLPILVLVASTYFLPRDHAFVISAETKGVIVGITNQTGSQWRIPEAVLCKVRTESDSAAPSVNREEIDIAEVPCGSDGYTTRAVRDLEVSWPVGTRLHIARNNSGPLVVTVSGTNPDATALVEAIAQGDPSDVLDVALGVGTRIVIPDPVWRKMGPMTFAGTAQIGILPSSGSNDELLSGRYEILETLTFNDNPVKVKSDTFVPGDQVQVVDGKGEPVAGRGFISNVDLPSKSGLLVVLTTPTIASELIVERLGATRARQTADWTDRALNDPSVLAIASLLGLVLATVEFLSKIRSSGRAGRD